MVNGLKLRQIRLLAGNRLIYSPSAEVEAICGASFSPKFEVVL